MGSQAKPIHNQDFGLLLEIVREVSQELHPNRSKSIPISKDSRLDADLGLDSLGKLELINRVEKAFNVSLAEDLLNSAATPQDLFDALRHSNQSHFQHTVSTQGIPNLEFIPDTPHAAETLLDVIEWHETQHPQRLHIQLIDAEGHHENLNYAKLIQTSKLIAAGLQMHGLECGDTVALMLPTEADYFYAFTGILLAGGIPVPIYPPVRINQLEDHLQRQKSILKSAKVKFMITVKQAKPVCKWLRTQLESLQRIFLVSDLIISHQPYQKPTVRSEHTALLQYTSGSTGDPKGVILSHANLLANIRPMGSSVQASSNDVFISWLPLYHDMGLIGAWLGILYHAALLIIMSPLVFLKKPESWLWAIHDHKGTLSAAPNFAYELCCKRIRDEDIAGLNLESWRLAFNGAEPIDTQSMQKFCARFAKYGFKSSAMTPVYGLAENSVGLAFPELYRGPHVEYIDGNVLAKHGRAKPCAVSDSNMISMVACGKPLPNHQIRIVDEFGNELPERHEGRVQFKGPSSTPGYFNNPAASEKLFQDTWLNSGDMAYIATGEIYITGRSKDIIIRGGRNIYPQQLEQAIGNLAGIRKGCVAVFASHDRRAATESLVVVAETRHTEKSSLQQLRQNINDLALKWVETPVDDIVLAPPHTVLKTSSGKIRRAACRQLYEQGRLGKQSHIILQLTKLVAATFKPLLRRWWRRITSLAYSAYAYASLAVLAAVAWLAVMTLPKPAWRWRMAHGLAKLLQKTTFIQISVTGLENLSRRQPAIFVANHASYIDALLMTALLHKPVRFVAKKELTSNIFLHRPLTKLGVIFVERFDMRDSTLDARQLHESIVKNESLFIFPEGTFSRAPGLRAFHMGAFVTAVKTGVPVVPISIRGARNILRAESWLARHGQIEIHISTPVEIKDLSQESVTDSWQTALKLKDAVRNKILKHCGEPELP